MSRFRNEDHRAMVEELDAEMARLGLVDDGTGKFVPAPRSVTPAPENPMTQALPPMTTPVVPSVQPPRPLEALSHTDPIVPMNPPNHDWLKREADARAAQRELSLERNRIIEERQLLARERAEAMATIEELRQQQAALASRATDIPAVSVTPLTPEFRAEYPEIAAAMDAIYSANNAEIARIRRERQQEADDQAMAQEVNRRDLFLQQVRQVHPDMDTLLETDHFRQWKGQQARAIQLVLEETFNVQLGFTPQDLIDVMSRYKASIHPVHHVSEVPRGLHSVDPANVGIQTGAEPSGPSDFVFSVAEMRDPSLIDRWMSHPDHRNNRKAAMDKFDAAWARSVAYYQSRKRP